jgi:hypothetical protein
MYDSRLRDCYAPYIRKRWGGLLSLLEVTLQMDDVYQVVVMLRRRDAAGGSD